eukprot:GHVU01056481.1.p1 GENE.GHVU01056481.1~~GHVU01056481.1.p1  ORF type:complete len:322 (-),score=24.49 GHVU01056481.1:46-1011(-)
MLLLLFACLALGFAQETCDDVCGCYNNNPPFEDQPPPQMPGLGGIELEMRLFTRSNQNNYVVIPYPYTNIPSQYSGGRRTVFMMHGWQEDGQVWDQTKDVALQYNDWNVIVAHWQRGAEHLDYWLSAANTRMVGGCAAALAQRLVSNNGAALSRMHCLGLSLGGQVCGFYGKSTNGNSARISAMDPAGPAFEKEDPASRLDRTDAVFVDTIHTDGFELGLGYDVSHSDFYPNKGLSPQPPCEGGICSHLISRDYYRGSLDNGAGCTFRANPCTSTADADAGRCETCTPGTTCSRMGFNAENENGRGSFYLRTVANYPYCEN